MLKVEVDMRFPSVKELVQTIPIFDYPEELRCAFIVNRGILLKKRYEDMPKPICLRC